MSGYCGIGIINTKTPFNIGTLWRSAHCFGVDFIYTVGRRYEKQASDTMSSHNHVPLFNFKNLDDLINHLPLGCRLIGIEISENAHSLKNFVHPDQACYLLGAEDVGLNEQTIKRCQSIVKIEGASKCLNVAVAGSIVLYDRINKGIK